MALVHRRRAGYAAGGYGVYDYARAAYDAYRHPRTHEYASRVSNAARRVREWASTRRTQAASRRVARSSGSASYRSSRVARGGRRVTYGKRRKKSSKRSSKGSRGKTGLLSLMWKKLCTPMVYKATVAQAYAGLQGQRQFKWTMLGGESILTTLGSKRPSNFLFNTALGSNSTAALQDFGGTNWKLSVDKYIWDMRIQNRGNACMELKCYECLTRRNIGGATVLTDSNTTLNSIFSDSANNPAVIGQRLSNVAPGQASLPTGLANHWNAPTFTPYMSNEFVNNFKILKTHSFRLSPNEIVERKYYMSKKVFRGQYLLSLPSTEWQGDWTKVLLWSWVGMPVDDGTTSNQTKAKTDLFLQADVLINYHFIPGSEPLENVSYTNDINSIGQQYVINSGGMTYVVPASDTVETVPGYTSTLGTTTATDTTSAFVP